MQGLPVCHICSSYMRFYEAAYLNVTYNQIKLEARKNLTKVNKGILKNLQDEVKELFYVSFQQTSYIY